MSIKSIINAVISTIKSFIFSIWGVGHIAVEGIIWLKRQLKEKNSKKVVLLKQIRSNVKFMTTVKEVIREFYGIEETAPLTTEEMITAVNGISSAANVLRKLALGKDISLPEKSSYIDLSLFKKSEEIIDFTQLVEKEMLEFKSRLNNIEEILLELAESRSSHKDVTE